MPEFPEFPEFPNAENEWTPSPKARFDLPEFPEFPEFPNAQKKRFDWTPNPKVRFDWPEIPEFPEIPNARFDLPEFPEFPEFPNVENGRFDYSPATDNTFNSIGVEAIRRYRDNKHGDNESSRNDSHDNQNDNRRRPNRPNRRDRHPKGVAAGYDRPESFYSARSQFDEVDEIMVKIERGYAGVCGTRYAYNVGDTYWCDDRQYGLRTHCQVVSSTLHMCCVDTDGCNDLDDMRLWRF